MIIYTSCVVVTSSYVPPFGVAIDEKISLDETEVTVETWLTYYSWKLFHEGEIEAKQVLPDSNALEPKVWELFQSKSDIYDSLSINYYTNLPLGYYSKTCTSMDFNKKIMPQTIPKTNTCPFLNFPITGITYEQASSFCEWKTKIVGKGKVEYRLPTEEEWKDLSYSVLTAEQKIQGYPDSVMGDKKPICAQFNYKRVQLCEHFIEDGFSNSQMLTVGTYFPTKGKAYDVFGSVSEMVQEKGISKGGNYFLYANKSHYDSIQYYQKPEIWLGFRCASIKKE